MNIVNTELVADSRPTRVRHSTLGLQGAYVDDKRNEKNYILIF
jgi:hypothetical protein